QFRVVLGGGQNQHVALRPQNGRKRLRDVAVERMHQIRDHQPDSETAPGHQRTRRQVRTIVQLLHSLQNPLARLGADVGMVAQNLRNRDYREVQVLCDILQSGSHRIPDSSAGTQQVQTGTLQLFESPGRFRTMKVRCPAQAAVGIVSGDCNEEMDSAATYPRDASTGAVDPLAVPRRRLSTGAEIPAIGLGTFGSDRVSAGGIAQAVQGALAAGYRHLDCASVYGNED